jgi:hypothetical protein
MGEEEQRNGSGRKEGRKKSKYGVACSIVGSIISILMGYGKSLSLSRSIDTSVLNPE